MLLISQKRSGKEAVVATLCIFHAHAYLAPLVGLLVHSICAVACGIIGSCALVPKMKETRLRVGAVLI